MADTEQEREDWQNRAECLGQDEAIFFPDDGNYEPARTICNRCDVRLVCLDYAMRHKIKDGMWGGVSPEQRRKARRRQRLRGKEEQE